MDGPVGPPGAMSPRPTSGRSLEPQSVPWRWVAIGTVVPAALGLLEATQVYLGLELRGQAITWGGAAAHTLPSWVVLMLLLAPVVWLSHRYTLVTTRMGRWIVTHAVGALVFALFHLGATAWVSAALPGGTGAAMDLFVRLSTVYFVMDLLTYAAIALLLEVVWRYRHDRRRELEAARMLTELAEMRYRVLRDRLQPDFFFNALNSVAALMVRGDTEQGVDVLTGLGMLVRSAVRSEARAVTTLGEEFELVEGYLRIQMLRFPRRITSSVTIAPSLEGHRVSAMSVVPLVERLLEISMSRHAVVGISVTAQRKEAGGVEVVICHEAGEILVADLDDVRMTSVPPDRIRLAPGRVAVELTMSSTDPRTTGDAGGFACTA